MNTLYFGDNLEILRRHIADNSVDLVYLDPPFNSNRDYNVLFREQSGSESPAQIKAFGDTWNWAGAAEAWHEFAELCPVPKVIELMNGFKNAIGENDVMAYLVMMAPRLYHLHRVLKPTGSLYLHCDPTASAYLRLILDCIFSPKNFKNEIVWRRYGAHNDVGQGSRHFGRVHDTIFFYVKSPLAVWNQGFSPLDTDYVQSTYRNVEPETGRRFRTTPLTGPGGAEKGNPVFEWKGHTRAWRYSKATMERLDSEGKLYYSKTGYVSQKKFLDESKGTPVQDFWDDINALTGSNSERLGYPTQKPLALLERIIQASSNEGDVVLDPFCLAGDSLIVTPDGLRTIRDIREGDRVLTHTGQYKRVVRTHKRTYSGEMLRLFRAKSNIGLEITPNHPVLAVRAGNCLYDDRRCLPRVCRYHRAGKHLDCSRPKESYRLEWVDAAELREGDFVYLPNTVPQAAPASLTPPVNTHFNAKPFPETVAATPELMEWIGYFAAEGFVDNYSVHFANYEDAERIAELGCRLFGLTARITDRPYRCKHIRFCSATLSRFMEALVGRGAANKRLPEWVLHLPSVHRQSLLRGMLRGDGSFRQHKQDDLSHSYRYSSSSPHLAHMLYRILLAEGIVCGFQRITVSPPKSLVQGRTVRVNHPAYQVTVYDVVSVNQLLCATREAPAYKESIVRQPYDTYPFTGPNGENGWLHTLRRIERFRFEEQVFNLEVEGDHSYVTATMAVHNCGCGTAIIAAQKLNRRWLGIDITPIATSLVQKRLFDTFQAKNVRLLSKDDPGIARAFAVEGLPTDLAGARLLYDKDPTHKDFEMWAVGLVPAIPQEKKGADQGIDGVAYFQDNAKAPSKAVVQVKGGHVTSNQLRDLRGVMAREKAQLGFFVCLESPTQPMQNEALAAGFYQPLSGVGRRVPALQIRTIEQLLSGGGFDFPLYGSNVSFKQAQAAAQGHQSELEM